MRVVHTPLTFIYVAGLSCGYQALCFLEHCQVGLEGQHLAIQASSCPAPGRSLHFTVEKVGIGPV